MKDRLQRTTWLCIIIAISSIHVSCAQQFCPLGNDIIKVEWDGGIGKFIRSQDQRRSQLLHDEPLGLETETETEIDEAATTDTRNLRQRSLGAKNNNSDSNNNNNAKKTVFHARLCNCELQFQTLQTHFCLVQNGEDSCRVPADPSTHPVECLKTPTSKQIFIRNAWPVALLWTTAMLLYIVGTDGGRLGVRFFISKFCCCKDVISQSNLNIVNEIVARESDARRRFQRVASSRLSRRNEQDPVTYILKTKEYKKSPGDALYPSTPDGDLTLPMTPDNSRSFESSEDDWDADLTCLPCMDMDSNDDHDDNGNDNEDVVCTICIMEIEDGDRVAVLDCNHLFHSDCLKSWIKRKNTCPLCQSPNIAREKSDPDSASPSSDNIAAQNGGNDNGNEQENRMVRSTGVLVGGSDTRFHRRRQLGLGVQGSANPNRSVQRDLFHVNGRGRGVTGRGRMIMVGDPASTVRIQVNRSNRERETPTQRRARLNNMRRSWNPS